jgi:hypothetical protein
MVVKASDLIARALALADLENTSFPTSTENRTYINLAFADVYQESINEGEKYWFQSVDLDDGENSLPEDFYQLYDIKIVEKNRRIPRKQRNMGINDTWYEIRKDKIILNKVPEAAIMEYWPKPIELDPTQSGDVDLDFPNHIFYQICALKLAEYYKIKQSGDISGIELLLENAWDTYYKILGRDNDQPLTITDVYTYRRVI